jgi:HsdM-like protein
MLTGEIRSQIDQIWNAFWSGGISNPLEVIEQITYLLFLKRLDEQEIAEELKANRASIRRGDQRQGVAGKQTARVTKKTAPPPPTVTGRAKPQPTPAVETGNASGEETEGDCGNRGAVGSQGVAYQKTTSSTMWFSHVDFFDLAPASCRRRNPGKSDRRIFRR